MRRVEAESKWNCSRLAGRDGSPSRPLLVRARRSRPTIEKARSTSRLREMKPFSVAGLPPDELNAFLSGAHSDPFRILGPHRMGDDLTIRIFRPDARQIDIL